MHRVWKPVARWRLPLGTIPPQFHGYCDLLLSVSSTTAQFASPGKTKIGHLISTPEPPSPPHQLRTLPLAFPVEQCTIILATGVVGGNGRSHKCRYLIRTRDHTGQSRSSRRTSSGYTGYTLPSSFISYIGSALLVFWGLCGSMLLRKGLHLGEMDLLLSAASVVRELGSRWNSS